MFIIWVVREVRKNRKKPQSSESWSHEKVCSETENRTTSTVESPDRGAAAAEIGLALCPLQTCSAFRWLSYSLHCLLKLLLSLLESCYFALTVLKWKNVIILDSLHLMHWIPLQACCPLKTLQLWGIPPILNIVSGSESMKLGWPFVPDSPVYTCFPGIISSIPFVLKSVVFITIILFLYAESHWTKAWDL